MNSLEFEYYEWLVDLVGGSERPGGKNYDFLLDVLYKKDFVWFVPNDDNREADGLDIREEFIGLCNPVEVGEWVVQPCTMLEMLVGLAKRFSFQTSLGVIDSFWLLITNPKLHQFTDERFMRNQHGVENEVDDILDNIIYRSYPANGVGGLFPLHTNNGVDLAQKELWYQLCNYIAELD